MRKRKLTDRLVVMKRRERGKSAGPEELSAEDAQRLVAELFARLQAKQAGVAGKTPEPAELKPPTTEEIKERVLAEISVTEGDLESLARERGEVVREHLLESGKLTNERVFLLDAGAAEPGHENVRTQLALGVGS